MIDTVKRVKIFEVIVVKFLIVIRTDMFDFTIENIFLFKIPNMKGVKGVTFVPEKKDPTIPRMII